MGKDGVPWIKTQKLPALVCWPKDSPSPTSTNSNPDKYNCKHGQINISGISKADGTPANRPTPITSSPKPEVGCNNFLKVIFKAKQQTVTVQVPNPSKQDIKLEIYDNGNKTSLLYSAQLPASSSLTELTSPALPAGTYNVVALNGESRQMVTIVVE